MEEAVGPEAPTTTTEWHTKVKAAKVMAKQLPPAPRLSGAYLLPWHLRALLRDRMVYAGIPKLQIDAQATVYQLMHLCPDQSQFLYKVHQYLLQVQGESNLSATEFVKLAALPDTPPELLSMWPNGLHL